jgi:hypothetical protein
MSAGAAAHRPPDLRCRFSVDDCIWFLRDIARQNFGSIFENEFLAFWRGLHDENGLKVQFNLYLEDLDTGFTLREMPDRYAGEWRQNADWMRLTFHARADRPDYPYAAASYDEVARDLRAVTAEIGRFAGPELLSACTTLHWGTATIDGCRALRDGGIAALVGYFELRQGQPWVAYYLDPETTAYLNRHDTWYDERLGLLFIKHDLVLNCHALDDIVHRLDGIHARPDEREVLELMIHEQYFAPTWHGYQPDAQDKVRRAAAWVTQHQYRWAFFEDW